MTPTLATLYRDHLARMLAIDQLFRERAVALAVERREALEAERVRYTMAVKGVRT